MADGKFYWLKLKRDFFKRHDIRIIESMPNGKDYILFYLKLLCESVDHEGNLRFSESIPYSEEMLSTITDTNIDIVRSAIKIFTELNMMEILDDGTYFMAEVDRMIGSAADNDHALRQARYRERQKALKQEKVTQALLESHSSVTKSDASVTRPVTKNNESKSKRIEKEIEIETERDIYAPAREEPLPPPIRRDPEPVKPAYPAEMTQCMDLWNGLQELGIKPVLDIAGQRYMLLTEILQKYGMDGYSKAIDMVRASDFLQGKNDRGWKITFDWFVKQSNFAKVLEGNYANETETKDDAYLKMVEEWERKANGDKQRIYKA